MGTVIIQSETVKDPITVIGRNAGTCYGSDTSDDKKNYERGIDCINHRHGRTYEFGWVSMVLDGYSAKVIREFYTHIGGSPTRLQASTRYIGYGNFKYIVPDSIKENSAAAALYQTAMLEIREKIRTLEEIYHIPKEDSSMLLPFGMTTKCVVGTNGRNLMDMSRNRECHTAFWEYRDELFPDIKKALSEYSEEWKTFIDLTFYPKCKELGYCPEEKCCGRYPKQIVE
ncbi:FAD-dependent thymidylate synthase [Ruminococcus sp.]|uniref:FAD-dependent thymidylate synthase n=1 Tax=Ruminococcus sp. TaxID=41978 RepID=UPI001B738E6F|nr:FAD-dependent thymidylate synthase [Ruminococcus sp.]MBP5433726.1 FAD-dependent thymidylate synthase [Ruminococcus sp.]